ncbi:hypothetical protein NQZ68_002542 [Dissostichus eleginoides]|nr:hypothetical protein NQZ68_002542 [Dissostichus eleginoides]
MFNQAATDWTAALLPPAADTLSRRGIGAVRSGSFPRSWDKLEPRDTENSAGFLSASPRVFTGFTSMCCDLFCCSTLAPALCGAASDGAASDGAASDGASSVEPS